MTHKFSPAHVPRSFVPPSTVLHDDLFAVLLDDATASPASDGFDLVAQSSPSVRRDFWARALVLTIALSCACGGVVDDPADPATTGSEPATEPTETSDPSTPDQTPSTEEGDDVEEVEPTVDDTGDGVRLTSIHESVFVAQGCTAGYCHGSFGLGSPADVVEAFVDVEAAQPTCGRTHYVVPGDPEASILWVRVRPLTDEDVECEVTKMPKGSETGLDPETAQLIHDWIADGALL